ncbi:MAG: chondroitinase-B domain-containing protein [Bacteroidia bacterium]
MNLIKYLCSIAMLAGLFSMSLQATVYRVNSIDSYIAARGNAVANDSIIWDSGVYTNIVMNITKDSLYVGAEELGGTIFNGSSKINITGDYVTAEGFQFVGANTGRTDIITIRGSYALVTQINIKDCRSYKYLRIFEESRHCVVSYCNFENRFNLDDQNILSILVDNTEPGYHKVQHCSFKNFDGSGNDLGIEPIRIGVSSQANFISRSLVEYCYFTRCNGDGELISSKATQNVYRFNTFENNPLAELVLRHGSEAVVYGNFFINGKGGVRIREGQDHYIYNNYFEDLNDRTIYTQNQDDDRLDNINIAFNTIVDCDDIRLGGSGSDQPTNVTFANNIFTDPKGNIFEDQTGNETWIGNIAFGTLGIAVPASGITVVDPQLMTNGQGYYGLSMNSPAIDAAEAGYAPLPQFPGMDPVDTDVLFDIMGQNRPATLADRDLGCSEFPHTTTIAPIATEENTGPSYDTDLISSIDDLGYITRLAIAPNPTQGVAKVELTVSKTAEVGIAIYGINGKLLDHAAYSNISQLSHRIDLSAYANGMYFVRLTIDGEAVTRKIAVQK